MNESDFNAARRRLLQTAMLTAAGTMIPWDLVQAQSNGSLTIAYSSDVPMWDPTAMTVPPAQSIYETVFDSPLRYSAKLKLEGRQIREWKWQDKNAQRLEVTLRDDILFHDGSRLTTEDLKFSLLERPRANKKLVVGAMFQSLADIEIISPTRAVLVYNKTTPAAPIYLAFLTGYIVPKAYMQKVGDAGFLEKPVGAGPYKLVDYQRGSHIVLESFDKYWGGAPPIKQVIFQILPEPTSRVAAVESGRAGVAVQVPMREATRLGKVAGLTSKIYPDTEIYMLRIPSYVKPFDDINVRTAMHYAIDTEALSKAFYAGVAPTLSTTATPGTAAYVPDFKFPYDPKAAIAALAKSGYGPNKPVKIPLLTTNGAYPSDFDMARAIVGMFQRVGIQADLQVVDVATALSQVTVNKLAGAWVYNWANSTGDPENYTGRIFDPRLRFSAWKDDSLIPKIDALFTEVDETKRIDMYKKFSIEASKQSWVIPLLQAVTTIVYRSNVEVKIFDNGYILPAEYRLKSA